MTAAPALTFTGSANDVLGDRVFDVLGYLRKAQAALRNKGMVEPSVSLTGMYGRDDARRLIAGFRVTGLLNGRFVTLRGSVTVDEPRPIVTFHQF